MKVSKATKNFSRKYRRYHKKMISAKTAKNNKIIEKG